MRMQRYTFFHKPPNVFKRKFQKSWITTTYTLYNIRPTKSSSFHHLSTFIHSKTTRKMLASTRPNLKAQGPTRQKTTINPRFTSPQTAITALLARKSYALTIQNDTCKNVVLHKSLIDSEIAKSWILEYLPTKNIWSKIMAAFWGFCKNTS